MAQGSKPGEGGQLPGHKIDEYIGWVGVFHAPRPISMMPCLNR